MKNNKIFSHIFFTFAVILGCMSFSFAENTGIYSDGQKLQGEFDSIKSELSKRDSSITAQSDDVSFLKQRINELRAELDSAKSTIVSLQQELQNQKSLTAKNLQQVTPIITPLPTSFRPVSFSQNSGGITSDINKQLDISSNTIIEQTKQLSKAYDEIEMLKRNSSSSDRLIENIISQGERLMAQGKNQEAAVIFELLDRLDIKKQRIYQNLARSYEALGMTKEATRTYNKLFALYPGLKGQYNQKK